MKRISKRAMILLLALALSLTALAYWMISASDGGTHDTPAGVGGSNLDLGVSYLTVTPGVAKYYRLEPTSGALVTRVVKGSLADRLGIEAGEVIVRFNGAVVGQRAPLLGMMHGCHVGSTVVLDIWGQTGYRRVEFDHF